MQHVGEDDEISEVSSGLGASTVDSRQHEQDLAGFPDVEHSRDSALSAVAEAFEGDATEPQATLVRSPVKTAASENSGDAQGIGTSVHPSRQDVQVVRTLVSVLAALLAQLMKPNTQLIIQTCERMRSCLPARKDGVLGKPNQDDLLKKQHDVLEKRHHQLAKQHECATAMNAQQP